MVCVLSNLSNILLIFLKSLKQTIKKPFKWKQALADGGSLYKKELKIVKMGEGFRRNFKCKENYSDFLCVFLKGLKRDIL